MAFILIIFLITIHSVFCDTGSDDSLSCPARCDVLNELDSLRGEIAFLRQLSNQEAIMRSIMDQENKRQNLVIEELTNKLNEVNKTTDEVSTQLMNQESLLTMDIDGQLKNHNNEIQTLKNSLTSANVKIGQVTSKTNSLEQTVQQEVDNRKKENTPIAFTVSTSSPLSNYNRRRIKYDKILINQGQSYSNITGIFTCTTPGTYVFTWSTMSNVDSQYCAAYIYHNNNELLMSYSNEHNSSGSRHEVASNTIVLSLAVGDTVWIQTTTCLYNFEYPYTAFSGWKI